MVVDGPNREHPRYPRYQSVVRWTFEKVSGPHDDATLGTQVAEKAAGLVAISH
ncbi:hypothetical protein VDGD_21784 [Verticillium dahliae]|nr:hypothetical protein VDGD_21784 [Verticillium dahliae]